MVPFDGTDDPDPDQTVGETDARTDGQRSFSNRVC